MKENCHIIGLWINKKIIKSQFKKDGGKIKMMILKIIFPLLMVAGALGSLTVEIVNKGDWATALQWIGACLLYTALTFRNIG